MLNKIDNNYSQTKFLSVQEAADYLGVHAATVRRWAYAKLLKGRKVGIRGDWRFTESDLEKMAKPNDLTDFSTPPESLLSPHNDWSTLENNSHIVQFYEDDAFLLESIRRYIETGDAAIVIATGRHRAVLKEMLRKGRNGSFKEKYIFLDAAETLSKFMINGVPNAKLFNSVIGGIIRVLSKKHKNIRAYGEMVALLWEKGNKIGAIRLEELWNNLQKKLPFTLYCAYPMKNIGGSNTSNAFTNVCISHSDVLPTESYLNLHTHDERLREIAILQQKAQALEAEIHEHKKTEAKLLQAVDALKASEEFNRLVIENSADCIKVLDLKGNLIKMNQPGCKNFEIDDITLYIGQDYRNFWKGRFYDDASSAVEAANNGGVGRFQGFCPTAKGTPKWWDVIITPIYDSKGNIDRLLAISRDITLLKELEQRKEDFLSATSHELKTPLTSQKAFVQLLQKQLEKDKDSKYSRFISKIGEQTDKLTKLVTDLLDVSKVHGGKLVLNRAQFDINECVKEAVEEVQAISTKHKIKIKGKIDQKVNGDKERLSQVIVNLLTNAAKYSPNADKIDVTLKKKGKLIFVAVRDFGIGINKKDQDRVFDRFYRVSEGDEKTYPGLGMGLYIASEIIKQHGGSISVNSVKGKGSTFSFTLPVN